jgi:phage/plasmid-like protein (TIGR03299 family)
MAHQIKKYDAVQSLNGAEWHGLAKKVDSINFEESPLNHAITEKQIAYVDTTAEGWIDVEASKENAKLIQNYKALVSEGCPIPLNICRNSYTPIQNQRLWEAIGNGLDGFDHKVTTIGTLDNRKKVFVSVDISELSKQTINGDEFYNYLTFMNSHDSSSSLEVYDTSVRIVCMNTLQYSRSNKGLLNFKVRHTKNYDIQLTDVEESIQSLIKSRMKFADELETLAKIKLTKDDANLLAFSLVDVNSVRSKNKVDEITSLFSRGKGCNGENAYDLLNAFTEYNTHYSKGNRVADRLNKQVSASEFGSGSDEKANVFSHLTNEKNQDENFDTLKRKGKIKKEFIDLKLANK